MKKILVSFLFFSTISTFSQQANNSITPALLFLELDPNARTAAIGEIGVISSPNYRDAGVSQNPALLSGENRVIGGVASYSKWMKNNPSGISLSGFKGFYSIDKKNAVSLSFTSFRFGKMLFTDNNGNPEGYFRPWEYSIGANYARLIKEAISLGVGIKYCHSKLYPNSIVISGYSVNPINTFAIDLGIQFKKSLALSNQSRLNYQFGCAINNFGPKVKFTNDPEEQRSFLPTHLCIGALLNPEFNLDDDFRLNIDLAYQVDKYLIPTPPKYLANTDSILEGMNPNISSFQAFYQSFYDAPGGFAEELHEIMHKFGGEVRINYCTKAYIALRAGKYFQHETKGNRNNTTIGFGVGVYGFTLDCSIYKGKNKPMVNTTIFSVGFRTQLDKLLRF